MRAHTATALFLTSLLAAGAASAQTASATPDYSLSFNVGATTDYRFRSISQSSFKPAVQAGADFSHKSGAYAGVWGSNVNWIKDYEGATQGSMELDLYAGYKGSLTKDLGFDVGIIGYVYPSNNAAPDANTTEIYGALSYGVFTVKYSRSISNFVSNASSTGSTYLEASATMDVGNGFSITPHIGRQTIPNQGGLGDYVDLSLTLGKDLGNGISASVTAYTTDAKSAFYQVGTFKNLGKGGLALGVKYSF